MKETKQVNQLPDGWRVVSLNQIADIIPSNVDKKIYPNEIPVFLCNYMDVYSNEYLSNKNKYSGGSVTLAELQKFKLKKGDVIITKDSETPDDIAVPAVVVEDMHDVVCGYHLALIRPKIEVEGEYLSKAFQTYFCRRHFGNTANGATRYGLTQKVIATCPIILPPKPEQSTIANILSTIDQAIEKTEQLITKYERIKIGLMQDLLTCGIDEQGNIRSEDTHEFKDSVLGRIPKEWEIMQVKDFSHLQSGGTPLRTKAEFWNGTVSWIKTTEINYNTINKSEESITEVGLKNSSAKLFPKGSILMAMYGEGVTRGRVAILGIEAATNQACLAIIIDTIKVERNFFYYYLIDQYDSLRELSNDGSQKNLSKSLVGNYFVKMPGLIEQQRIASLFDDVFFNISELKNILSKYLKLKNALMQDLLTGEVRVDALLKK